MAINTQYHNHLWPVSITFHTIEPSLATASTHRMIYDSAVRRSLSNTSNALGQIECRLPLKTAHNQSSQLEKLLNNVHHCVLSSFPGQLSTVHRSDCNSFTNYSQEAGRIASEKSIMHLLSSPAHVHGVVEVVGGQIFGTALHVVWSLCKPSLILPSSVQCCAGAVDGGEFDLF